MLASDKGIKEGKSVLIIGPSIFSKDHIRIEVQSKNTIDDTLDNASIYMSIKNAKKLKKILNEVIAKQEIRINKSK